MLTVEIIQPERHIFNLASRKGASKIIASWHEGSGKMKQNGDLVKEKYLLKQNKVRCIPIVN